MARVKMTKTKIDSIYWYKQGKEKKFAYRYKYYDSLGKRREKSKQNFDTIEQAERALIDVKAAILDGNNSYVENDNLTVAQLKKYILKLRK
ncbi:Arm DNA-binding domain-containing protein [Sporosarcina sp. ITBMC105]